MILKYTKVRPDIIVPTRSNPSDAGLDLYFNPKDGKPLYVSALQAKLFQTGIKLEIPHGYVAEVKNRSGMAHKRSLMVGACVVDSGYSGEIFVDLHNLGDSYQKIKPGTKIAQLVVYPVVQARLLEVEEIYEDDVTISNRGEGSLGSTD